MMFYWRCPNCGVASEMAKLCPECAAKKKPLLRQHQRPKIKKSLFQNNNTTERSKSQ